MISSHKITPQTKPKQSSVQYDLCDKVNASINEDAWTHFILTCKCYMNFDTCYLVTSWHLSSVSEIYFERYT